MNKIKKLILYNEKNYDNEGNFLHNLFLSSVKKIYNFYFYEEKLTMSAFIFFYKGDFYL
jgi:hypothetical protein